MSRRSAVPLSRACSVITLDRSRPLGEQIVSQLAGAIQAGRLAPGERLPSIRALAGELGVNRNTVAHAFRELAQKGYVETRYGGGSVVSAPAEAPPAQPAAEAAGPAAPAVDGGAFTATDWERRLARRLNGSLAGGRAPQLGPAGQADPINMFQLRPQTDLFPQDRFRQCLNTVLSRPGRALLNYGAPAGYLPLREQIARRLRAAGVAAEPSGLLVVSGSQQGIDLLARAFLDEGDGVVVESPTYSIALKLFAMAGARAQPFPIGPEGADVAALQGLSAQQPPKLIYAVPNFQNPTTHSYTREEKEALLTQAARLGCVVVEDASDQELHRDPAAWPPLAALDGSGRVVHVNTFSKTLVPALRVGYLAAPAPVIRTLTELKEMTDLSHSLLVQAAIAEFMAQGHFDEHVARVRSFYRARMERVLEMLADALPEETPFTRPGSGLSVWVDLPPHLDAGRLFERLREQGVLVSPGTLYQPAGTGRNGLRLCVANEPEARLARGFAVLGDTLRAALRQPLPTAAEQEYQAMH